MVTLGRAIDQMSSLRTLGLGRLRPVSRQSGAARLRPHATKAAPPPRLRAVFLNAARLDYDARLDYERLSSEVNITWHSASDPAAPHDILSRVEGHEVVINKEMPLSGDLIQKMASSVRLICEAGTGFNNVDVEAARAKSPELGSNPRKSAPFCLWSHLLSRVPPRTGGSRCATSQHTHPRRWPIWR